MLVVTPGKWPLSPLRPAPALLASGTHLAPVISGVSVCRNTEWLVLGRRALKNSKSILYLYKDLSLTWLEM